MLLVLLLMVLMMLALGPAAARRDRGLASSCA
jgi:hypothetical protein